jgi:glycosyltransferase involved in cell wall biosynthesis
MLYVDASPAVHHKAGLGRYAEDLIGALRARGTDLTVLYHDAAHAKPSPLIKSLPQVATAQGAYPWRLRALLAQLLNLAQDDFLQTADAGRQTTHGGPPSFAVNIFHATEHLLPRFKRAQTVFTLHDLIFKFFPQHHLPRNRMFLSLAMPLFLRRAHAVICVSEHTKRDAMRLYQLPEPKLRVVYEGVHSRFKRIVDWPTLQRARERYNLPEKFIVAVGTIEPRKNLPLLFEAFKLLLADAGGKFDDTAIIVVGKQGWLFEETFKAVHTCGLTGRVRFVGYVPDEDLPAVYSLAQVLAFPSVYEGFGFPPLEALACATPVISSNTASLPELLGDAALLLPPNEASQWVSALRQVLSDRNFARELGQRGPNQARKYTWERAAAETVRVYDAVLGRGATAR